MVNLSENKNKFERHLLPSSTDLYILRSMGVTIFFVNETPYLKVRRDLTWEKFNARMSEYFGVSDGTFRIWMFKRKQISTHDSDHEVWRPEPVDEDDVDRPIYSVRRSLFNRKLNLNSHADEWSL